MCISPVAIVKGILAAFGNKHESKEWFAIAAAKALRSRNNTVEARRASFPGANLQIRSHLAGLARKDKFVT